MPTSNKNTAGIEVPKWNVSGWSLDFWNGQEKNFFKAVQYFQTLRIIEPKNLFIIWKSKKTVAITNTKANVEQNRYVHWKVDMGIAKAT